MSSAAFFRFVAIVTIIVAFCTFCFGQTWNSNAGGYNTGYGTVYGTFGLAQATQNMYNSMQMNMQRTMMRSAMIKKWGLAAVEKAEREAKAGSTGNRTTSAASDVPKIDHVPPPPKNYGVFRPDATVNTGRVISDSLGETPEEKQLYLQIFARTKEAFEKEAGSKGWKNNIAGAFTFFIVSSASVYNGGEEPNEDSVTTLYQAINQTLDEIPEFATMSNRDKQGLYNTLIAFAGIPLAAYIEGQNSKDAATLKLASQLAGELIKVVLKIGPDRIRISDGVLAIT
jgi:hypothetical protein